MYYIFLHYCIIIIIVITIVLVISTMRVNWLARIRGIFVTLDGDYTQTIARSGQCKHNCRLTSHLIAKIELNK